MTKQKDNKQEETAIVTYGDWSPDQMKRESQEMASGGDFWKAPEGKTSVRFLPPKLGWPSPFVIQHQHFVRMPGQERPVSFCCPREHEKKPCVCCKKADALETSGNSRDERMARNLRPQKRVMANIIVNPKDETAKPTIWTFGTRVFNQLKSIREDDEGGGNFLDPVKGFNIVVQRKGTGKDDTTYTLIPSRNLTQLANMEWINMQPDLRRLIRIPTVEQQERLLAGEDPKDVWKDASKEGKSGSGGKVIDVEDSGNAGDDAFEDEIDIED